MRPIATGRSLCAPVRRAPGPADEAAPAARSECRSLVTINPAQRGDAVRPRPSRPSAPFLAHLIANAQQAPQTRSRRRAEPTEAMVLYRAGRPAQTQAGAVLDQTM